MTPQDRDRLDRDGYLILENYMGPRLLGELRERIGQLFLTEGEQAGSEFKREEQTLRLANLVDKGEVFRARYRHAGSFGADRTRAGPSIQVEQPERPLGQSLVDMGATSTCRHGRHRGRPGLLGGQHRLDCWTILPRKETALFGWFLGSHRWGKLPKDALTDLQAPHPDEILITGEAGTVVVMNAHMLAWRHRQSYQEATLRHACLLCSVG